MSKVRRRCRFRKRFLRVLSSHLQVIQTFNYKGRCFRLATAVRRLNLDPNHLLKCGRLVIVALIHFPSRSRIVVS